MNTSTIEARRSPGKRLGVFALAIAVACAGMFGLAASKAEAGPTNQPFQMELNRGLLNLGAAFVGKEILPAPAKLGESTVLPNWWDITESGIAAGALSGASANVCTETAGAASGANAYYPCGGNPEFGLIRAVGGTGNFSSQPGASTIPWPFGGSGSTWNPSTGAISLQRVVPGGSSPSGTPFNYDFQFPIMVVPSPLDGSPVPITLAATGNLTGTFDPATGNLSLSPATGNLESRVLVGLGIPAEAGGPQPFTYCSVPLTGATLSTDAGTGSKSFNGSPFNAGGLEGAGALQGSFTIAGASTPVTQVGVSGAAATAAASALTACAGSVDLVTQGEGGIWLGNRIDPPACKEDQVGVYPDCTDPKADITKIVVTGPSSVKGGKSVKLKVKVTNDGTADEDVKLALFSNSSRAKPPASVTVNAPAGSVGEKTVTVKTTKAKSKATAMISATNGAKTGKKSVKIK